MDGALGRGAVVDVWTASAGNSASVIARASSRVATCMGSAPGCAGCDGGSPGGRCSTRPAGSNGARSVGATSLGRFASAASTGVTAASLERSGTCATALVRLSARVGCAAATSRNCSAQRQAWSARWNARVRVASGAREIASAMPSSVRCSSPSPGATCESGTSGAHGGRGWAFDDGCNRSDSCTAGSPPPRPGGRGEPCGVTIRASTGGVGAASAGTSYASVIATNNVRAWRGESASMKPDASPRSFRCAMAAGMCRASRSHASSTSSIVERPVARSHACHHQFPATSPCSRSRARQASSSDGSRNTTADAAAGTGPRAGRAASRAARFTAVCRARSHTAGGHAAGPPILNAPGAGSARRRTSSTAASGSDAGWTSTPASSRDTP